MTIVAEEIEAPNEIEDSTRIVEQVDVEAIRETHENWRIYCRPSATDAAFIELVTSVMESGINTPLELSADRYIISGHRRIFAARAAKLATVPCLIDHDIYIGPMDAAERIALLTERNRGVRVKSDAEQYLEAAAKIDPEAAIRDAQQRKAQHFNKAKGSVELVETQGKSRRTDPSKARSELLNAVLEVLEELRCNGHLPIGSRHIHYRLLHKKVRTSSYANGFIYGTRKGSDGLLSKLLTNAPAKALSIQTTSATTPALRRRWNMMAILLDTSAGNWTRSSAIFSPTSMQINRITLNC